MRRPNWQIIGAPYIGSQMSCPRLPLISHPRLSARWGAPAWLPDRYPSLASRLGTQDWLPNGHPRLAPRWGTPDWPPDRAHQIGFQIRRSRLAPRLGHPKIALQIGTQKRYPRLASRVHWCTHEVPQYGSNMAHKIGALQISSHIGQRRLAPRWGPLEWPLIWNPR